MLNWIVAGVGDIAKKRVIPGILSEPRSRLYGVVTRDAAKGAAYGGHVWDTVEAAIADPAVDVVYIALPVAMHAPATIAALRAGKHVLCEKPVAMNHGEALEMVEAARESGKALGIAYYRRNYPKVQRALELLREGVIGKPVLAEISCHDWFNAEQGREWLVDPAMAGGGPLYDIGSHRIDLLNYFFGEPGKVVGQRSRIVHGRAVEDSATVLIEYGSGVRGALDVRWHCRVGRDEFRITGTDGVMDLSPLNGPGLRVGAREEMVAVPGNLHYPCIENFCSHVLDGAAMLSTGETAVWTDWVTERVVRGSEL